MQAEKQNTCTRCGAENGRTIRRLRDKIYTTISNAEFDHFVETIRREKITGEQARKRFRYELVALTSFNEMLLCCNCLAHQKSALLRNRKNKANSNTGNGFLF